MHNPSTSYHVTIFIILISNCIIGTRHYKLYLFNVLLFSNNINLMRLIICQIIIINYYIQNTSQLPTS